MRPAQEARACRGEAACGISNCSKGAQEAIILKPSVAGSLLGGEVVDGDKRDQEMQQALLAFRSRTAQVRLQELEKIEGQYGIGLPNTWLRRLGAARHLKDFTGKKEFPRSGLV